MEFGEGAAPARAPEALTFSWPSTALDGAAWKALSSVCAPATSAIVFCKCKGGGGGGRGEECRGAGKREGRGAGEST